MVLKSPKIPIFLISDFFSSLKLFSEIGILDHLEVSISKIFWGYAPLPPILHRFCPDSANIEYQKIQLISNYLCTSLPNLIFAVNNSEDEKGHVANMNHNDSVRRVLEV